MVQLVWLIGALIAAWGLTAVFQPELMKRFVKFLSVSKRYLAAGIVRILMAVIFLVFAGQTHIRKLTILFGLLFLAGGILVLVLPPARIKSILNWWNARPGWVYRRWGIAAFFIGAVIIYAGWPASR
jgi:hypothetical protein